MKFSLGVDRDPSADSNYSYSSSIRAALAISRGQYLVYGLSVGSPSLTRTTTGKAGAVSLKMNRLYWMYQPREGVSFTVGRDDLPAASDPVVSRLPAESKRRRVVQRAQREHLQRRRDAALAYLFGIGIRQDGRIIRPVRG